MVGDNENDDDYNVLMSTAEKEINTFSAEVHHCTKFDKEALKKPFKT